MNYKLPEKSTINFKNKFTNLIWYFVNTLIFPLTLRSNSLRRILLRSFGAKISKNSRISRLCKIEYPNNLTMGENSSIGNYCYILGLDKIEIGSNVCISDNVAILAGGHKLNSNDFELVTRPINIMDNVWVAYGSIINPGVTISKGSVVLAGSVVASSIESMSIFGGNPASFIKKRKL